MLWLINNTSQYFSYIVVVSFIGGGNRVSWENYQPAAYFVVRGMLKTVWLF